MVSKLQEEKNKTGKGEISSGNGALQFKRTDKGRSPGEEMF